MTSLHSVVNILGYFNGSYALLAMQFSAANHVKMRYRGGRVHAGMLTCEKTVVKVYHEVPAGRVLSEENIVILAFLKAVDFCHLKG